MKYNKFILVAAYLHCASMAIYCSSTSTGRILRVSVELDVITPPPQNQQLPTHLVIRLIAIREDNSVDGGIRLGSYWLFWAAHILIQCGILSSKRIMVSLYQSCVML